MKNSTRKIANGKGYLNINECMQIPTGLDVNSYKQVLVGYYVGTSFRVVRTIFPFSESDISHELLKLQVVYDKPLVAVKVFVGLQLHNVL